MAYPDERTDENRPEVKTILIVEDDQDIGEFLVEALKEEIDCQCLLAGDGFQALEQIRTLVPNLFLLDYQLPKMNGLELYDHLHEREELQHVPALFMNANLPVNELEKRRVYAIKKPFELEALLQQINTILKDAWLSTRYEQEIHRIPYHLRKFVENFVDKSLAIFARFEVYFSREDLFYCPDTCSSRKA